MSTRSMIGIQNKDGSIDAIYCYFDGYLDHVGRILFETYTNNKKIRDLIRGGEICSLQPCPFTSEKVDNGTVKHFQDINRYTASGDIWVEYYYLRVGRKWMYCTCRDKTLKLLAM